MIHNMRLGSITNLSLLSLNVLCGSFLEPLPIERHRHQAEKIYRMNPDILCLQEFNNGMIEKIYCTKFCSTHDMIIERRTMMDYVKKMSLFSICCIGSFYFHIFPFIFIMMHPYFYNFILGNQKVANVIFIRKGIPVSNMKSHSFKIQRGDVLNLMRHRGWTECIIFNTILIRNVHLNHQQPFMDYNHKFVKSQVDESFSNIETEKSIVVGDFNIETFNYPKDFQDVGKHLGPTYRKNNPLTGYYTDTDKRIDFIFTKKIELISVEKLMDMDSDHDGLYIRFRMPKNIVD